MCKLLCFFNDQTTYKAIFSVADQVSPFLPNQHLCPPVTDIRRRRPPVGTTDVVAAGIGSHLLRLGSLVTGETTYEIVCQIIHHTYDQHRLCA